MSHVITRAKTPRRIITVLATGLAFALIATACGGEVTDNADDVVVGSDPSTTTTTTAASTGEGATSTVPDEPSGPNIYEDPRGGIFADFQAGYDRGDNPFSQIDSFCTSTESAPDRVDTDAGITAGTISIVHIRSRLEDAVEIGFGIPVGDPAHMFEVFVDYVNNQCGGVRGRMIDLTTIEVPLFGPTVETDRNAACLEATEDHDAVIVVNSSGFQGAATVCITEEKETIFISTQGQTEEFMQRADGRLVSISLTLEESLRFSAQDLIAGGELEGKILGVVTPDTPGQPEAVEAGLVVPLRDAGIDVVFDQIGCGGSTICVDGVTESVANMKDSGISAFFNAMGILTAPGYINEMVNQGFEPGDVTFYASDFNSQASELVSSQIPNEPAAGALYNGATIRDFRGTGLYRNDGYAPTAWQDLCVGLYNDNNTIGANHQWQDQGGDSGFGMTVSVCSIMRIALRALYNAGDNPTRADVEAALSHLGPIDLGQMIPASITPGKGQAPDAIETLDFSYPCDQPYPYARENAEAVCITGRDDWRAAPR